MLRRVLTKTPFACSSTNCEATTHENKKTIKHQQHGTWDGVSRCSPGQHTDLHTCGEVCGVVGGTVPECKRCGKLKRNEKKNIRGISIKTTVVDILVARFSEMPPHTSPYIPFHIRQHHTRPCHTIPYHTVQCDIVLSYK